MTHIDEWIDRPPYEVPENEKYATFFFMLHRLDAIHQVAWEKWIKRFKLFCTWKGNRYRVTGCSRLGDVWIARNLNQTTGYDGRVDVAECSEWGEEP